MQQNPEQIYFFKNVYKFGLTFFIYQLSQFLVERLNFNYKLSVCSYKKKNKKKVKFMFTIKFKFYEIIFNKNINSRNMD